MRVTYNILRTMVLLLGGVLLSCVRDGSVEEELTMPVEVVVSADEMVSKSFSNNGAHTVDRILIIPFMKTSEAASNDDANFIPVYSHAVQRDVSSFPAANMILRLPVKTTYKVLVVGYSHADYNYYDQSNAANKFSIGAVSGQATLANFHLVPKSPTVVPEFFTCICDAYSGATNNGSAFKPEQGYSLSGNLSRLVSGLSLTVNNIPVYVEAISLVAENLTKASNAKDAAVVSSQSTGDGGVRLLARKVPTSSWNVSFTHYLLPTFDANKTGFYLDVEYGIYATRYVVKVADSAVSSANKFILNPNQAINLTGDYATINIGFDIGFAINLDDNAWDGYN